MPPLCSRWAHTCTGNHTHTHTHTRARAHAHTHTYTQDSGQRTFASSPSVGHSQCVETSSQGLCVCWCAPLSTSFPARHCPWGQRHSQREPTAWLLQQEPVRDLGATLGPVRVAGAWERKGADTLPTRQGRGPGVSVISSDWNSGWRSQGPHSWVVLASSRAPRGARHSWAPLCGQL